MKYSHVTTSSESNSAKNRACQEPIRFKNFIIVMINREAGLDQDLDVQKGGIAGLTKKKLQKGGI